MAEMTNNVEVKIGGVSIDTLPSTDDDKKDYNIKMDGEYRQFEGGGIRYTKTGKGRFDLIPSIALIRVMDKLRDFEVEPFAECNVSDMVTAVANRNFEVAILLIAYAKYVTTEEVGSW